MIGSIGVSDSQIAPLFALNRIFFPSSWEALLKNATNFLLIETNKISGKWKPTFASLYKPAHNLINKAFVQTNFCDFKHSF